MGVMAHSPTLWQMTGWKADMEELIQALAEYDEAMGVAFSDWHRARAGEMLAERLREIMKIKPQVSPGK